VAEQLQIIAFYEFKRMADVGSLLDIKAALRELFAELGVRGTIILADEGYNGMVCGLPGNIEGFIARAGEVLRTQIDYKSSFHETAPFRRIDIKIKPEIVTLKQSVDMTLGRGTHVSPEQWNSIISDPETLVLDTRNRYEYATGTFENAVDPGTAKFSELPAYVAEHLDPEKHKRVAMFCTGGIRCEKFAPYLKQLGFEEVYQLQGGILKYLETVPEEESLWRGECFVFDERISVDKSLQKGGEPDHSQRRKAARK
jgi:UPF0176 protein